MKRALLTIALITCSLFSARSSAAESAEVIVPFRLTWGVTVERIEGLLQKSPAKIVSRKQEHGEEVFYVENLGGKVIEPIKQTLFVFREGRLTKIVLRLADAAWDSAKYQALYDAVGEHIARQYGKGEPTAQPGSSTTQSTTLWERPATNIALTLAKSESGDDGGFRIDVLYAEGRAK